MASKHYSGKPVGKRALSLLMALVMSLSLVQITALAVDGGMGEPTTPTFEKQVMDGWFDASGNKVETGTTGDKDKGFTLSKTIKQTGVNAFNITLTVETTQKVESSDAAVQLVIDTSGSMAFCSVCGKENHGKNDKCKGSPSRLAATKAAINDDETGFLANLLSGNTTGGAIWVSVVEFASGAYTVCEWEDITVPENLEKVKQAVRDLVAGGGTNLEAGLMLARNRLDMEKVKGAASKYTVLLTDGEPTYRVTKDFTSTGKIESDTTSDGDGSSCSVAERNEAKEMAEQVKALSNLYTICYGVADDVLSSETKDVCVNCTKSQREHEKDWVWDLFPIIGHFEYYCDDSHETVYEAKEDVVTVGSFLRDSIASKPEFAFNASSNVNEAFKNIASSTVTGMNGAGTFVTDPMGTFINLSDAEKARLNTISGVSVEGSTIQWHLNPEAATTTGEDGTTTFKYTLTYSITLDTAARGFESNKNYPTNGRTFLTIPAEEEGAAASEVDFNIPGIFGQVPEVSYTVNYFYQSQTADDEGNRAYVQDTDATVNGTAALWSTITVADKTKANYTINAAVEGATPAPSNQLVSTANCVFNVYYDWNEPQQPDPTYTLTVKYQDEAGNQLKADVVTGNLAKDSPYTADNSDIEVNGTEYTYKAIGENSAPLTGTITGDTTVIIIYQVKEITPPEPEKITVTVNYVDLNDASNVLREPQSKQFEMTDGAADYDVTDLKVDSLDKDGKTYNYDSASGNLMGETQSDLEITLYYKVEGSNPINPPVNPTYSYYTVTVNYFDKDSGAALRTAYSITQREYTSYDVTAQDAIAIEGYTYAETTGDALKGTLNGNKTINVYYTKDSTPVNPPVTPVDPPVDPNPVAPPETGDAMGFWIAAAAVSGLGLVWLALSSRKRREEA